MILCMLGPLMGCGRREEGDAVSSTGAAAEGRVPSEAATQAMAGDVLMQAALNGKLGTVKAALASGTSVHFRGPEGRTALMLASFNGHTKVATALLRAGAEPNVHDSSGRTALMFASTGPYPETVALLIRCDADVNAVDTGEGWTPLMFAAAEGHREVVRVLLNNNADPTATDADGDTAASFARQSGHQDLARSLQALLSP